MKTKEECLLRNGVFKNDLNGYSTNVMKAMDEYASQFQQEWIPVEVRLPEERDTVWWTSDNGTVIKLYRVDNVLRYSEGTMEWPLSSFIAWKPIITPQPYNPKQP